MAAPRSLVVWLARYATDSRMRYYPLAINAAFLVFWVLTMVNVMMPADPTQPWSQLPGDFYAFFAASRLWLSGSLDQLYDLQAQYAMQCTLHGGGQAGINVFMSPPIALLLFAPFALGRYVVGHLAWYALGALAIWSTGRRLHRHVLGLGDRPRWHTFALILGWLPTAFWLSFSQASPLILWCWGVAYVAMLRGHDLRAGLALSLLIFKPQLALPMALLLLLGRRWRALAGGILGGALGALVSAALFWTPTLQWWSLRGQWVASLRQPDYPIWGIHSLFGVSNLLLSPSRPLLADGFTAVTSAITVAALARLWWRAPWAPRTRAWRARVSITLMLGLLLCVHLFAYDLMLWLLPMLIVQGILWAPQASGVAEASEPALAPHAGARIIGWSALLHLSVIASFASLNPLAHWSWSLGLGVLQPTLIGALGWSWAVYTGLVRSAPEAASS